MGFPPTGGIGFNFFLALGRIDRQRVMLFPLNSLRAGNAPKRYRASSMQSISAYMLIVFCQTVTRATTSALGIVGPIVLETLTASVDLLEFAPVPGLQAIVKALLNIWEAVQEVDVCHFYLTDAYSVLDLS